MIYLALGSNLAGAYRDSRALLDAVPAVLAACGIDIVAASRLYKSRPQGGPSGQDDFLNFVVKVRCVLSPEALLARLHTIEADFGRKRRIKWEARSLDIDIIDMYGICAHYRVALPHPRLAMRSFVLYPLRDVARGWHHPQTGQHIDALIASLPPQSRRAICACAPPYFWL